MRARPPTEPSSEQDFTCSYREPDSSDGFNVVKCAGDFCQIGYFHLRCLRIEQLPHNTDDFYCNDCAPFAGRRQLVTNEGNTVEDGSSVPVTKMAFSNDGNGPYQEILSKESSAVTGEPVTRLCTPPLFPGSKTRLVKLPQSSPGFVPVNQPAKPHRHTIIPPSTSTSVQPLPQIDGQHDGDGDGDGETHFIPANQPPHSPPPLPISRCPPQHRFITPSLSDADPHALTADEARLFWCWRASQPESKIVKMLPSEERRRLEEETGEVRERMRDLEGWWAAKGGNRRGKLSEVLEGCEV